MTGTASLIGPAASPVKQDRLLRALRLEPVDRTPVWFMRQAGRSQPEYRSIKERYSLLEICRQPELCAQVTVQPVDRLGVDAAILYSDIMTPLVAIGVDLEIVDGVGPVIEHPVRAARDVEALRPLESADVQFVGDAIRCTLQQLDERVPLIGFAGAPFTLASYLIEGKPSRDFLRTKGLMYAAPGMWHDLMRRLSGIVAAYMLEQVGAGVHALQLFDSWAGALSPDDYRRYVAPYSALVFDRLRDTGIPLIHFGTGTAGLLEQLRDAGGTTVGVDWRVSLDRAWERIGYNRGIQGNLDPLLLLAPWEVLERETLAILELAAGRQGHVFNLGHGIHPSTSPDQLQRLVELVHGFSAGHEI